MEPNHTQKPTNALWRVSSSIPRASFNPHMHTHTQMKKARWPGRCCALGAWSTRCPISPPRRFGTWVSKQRFFVCVDIEMTEGKGQDRTGCPDLTLSYTTHPPYKPQPNPHQNSAPAHHPAAGRLAPTAGGTKSIQERWTDGRRR